MDFVKEKIYIPSQTPIYEPEIWVFAGVEAAGKTSMMGTWDSVEGRMMETTLTEADICSIKEASLGHFTRMNYIGLDTLEEHLARIENRVSKGGASADPEDVKKQFECRWEALSKVLPFCKEIHFYDNENGFRCVGTYRNNTMEVSKKSCRWFREYLSDWYLNVQPATEHREHIFQSRLSMSEIEENFSDMSFFDELMGSLKHIMSV